MSILSLKVEPQHAQGRGRAHGADRRVAQARAAGRRSREVRTRVGHPAEIARREAGLAAIAEVRQRPRQRQCDANPERGRDPDKPPRGVRYKREFGVPEDMAQDNFTDPDGRIMKRAGGGPDDSYSAQAAVDDEAHIIVAAALTNNASDTGELPGQALADTGYRSEALFEAMSGRGCDLGKVGTSARRCVSCADLP